MIYGTIRVEGITAMCEIVSQLTNRCLNFEVVALNDTVWRINITGC